MNNEEKNVVPKKNNKLGTVIIILIIILIGVLSFVAGYCISANKLENKEVTNDNIDNNIIEDNTAEEISLENNTVKNLINMVSYIGALPYNNRYADFFASNQSGLEVDKYFGIYYKQNKLLASDIYNEVKMLLTVNNFDYHNNNLNDGNFTCEYTVSEEILEETYHKIFGKNANYQFTSYNNWLPTLEKENGNIIIAECGGDTRGPVKNVLHGKMIKAEKTNNEIYLYEIVTSENEVEEQSTGVKHFYTDINQTTKIASNLTVDEVLKKYEDKLSQYKYTFKLEDGNYYFYSVERVK